MSSYDCMELCRLCLVKDRVSVPIFEGEGDVRQIFLKIAACLPVKVGRDDKLPKKICDDCVYKVELLYDFWNTTANAEKQLLQWLGEDGEDKQGYVSSVMNSELMKQETVENRLDSSVMQTEEHQNNMNMNMMDQMGLTMPMIMSTDQQQITSVPMASSGNNIQVVAGTSSQSSRGRKSGNNEDDEEESEDEENSEDECDNDGGINVKEETPESGRNVEPSFVNVSIPCEEAGPSGVQQQKITDMPEMVMAPSEGDPKSGSPVKCRDQDDNHGLFIFDRASVVMRKWQILEFDGKPYYAFVPENEEPLDPEEIPSLDDPEDESLSPTKLKLEVLESEEEALENDESFYDYQLSSPEEQDPEDSPDDVKPILINGIADSGKTEQGDLYQVKIEGSVITLEKLAEDVRASKSSESILPELEGDQTADEDIHHDISDHEEQDRLEEDEEQPQEVPNYEKRQELEAIEFVGVGAEDEDEEQVDDVEALSQESNSSPQAPQPKKTKYRQVLPTSSAILKCKVCGETFASAIAFRKHVAWTHKKKVCIQEDGAFICAVCDYRTLKKSLFAAHLERKHETWPRKGQGTLVFPCAVCGFVCRSKHSLQSHFIRKHTDKYEHQCKFCPKKFKVKGDLTNHVRFHHKEKPINCDVCGKLCQNTGSLYVHQKWAHYKPKYECPICKRRMVTQENLDQHMVTQHEKREKIVCAECGKTFTKKDSFKRHMAVHTGSKPHACPICAKPFARQSQLRQHVLIHTGKRPFVCDICGKAFTQKPGLICHRKTHPGPHPPLPVMPIADLVNEFTAEYLQEAGHVGQDEDEEEEEVDGEEEEVEHIEEISE
ncbi:zinc finger protein 652-like isoform X1 [Diachasmimorpha longicaudata]|uniref:zinc finger protein 652-like isoform X1 n=1 Tax=Diachasmimorpha longicaudata TaxID=58733 RepID=UPI0030B8AA9A